MTETDKTDPLKATRQFRQLRSQLKRDLGLRTLTRGDRILIDQAALLALRARQMRDNVLTGDKPVSDEDLVRCSNASIRAMAAIEKRKDRAVKDAKPKTFEERMAAMDAKPRRVFDENDF